MAKKVALQTDPTTDGSITIVPSMLATLNGMPIATQGSSLVYKGNPGDMPLEFVSGVFLNNKPLTYVGAKTAAGATILSANLTTATIEVADDCEGAEEKEEDEVSKKVTLESKYPMLQLHELAIEVAKSSFYFLLSAFFDDDIPIIAYEKLYMALMDDKDSMMPPIVVLSKGLSGIKKASYDRKKKQIEVREDTILLCIEGSAETKIKARAELLQGLLEEYGHFLDDVLRNQFSNVKGDAHRDEGAVYSYYFTNYKIEDKAIDFAIAKIDGAPTELTIDLSSIVQSYKEQKSRIENDYQNREKEYFVAGKGNVLMKEYGHFDFANTLKDKKILDDLQLSWLYLGNYMRDMSQVITPVTTEFTDAEHAEMDALDPDMRGIFKHSFFDALKLTRKNWTRVVEIMAAHHTMEEIRGEKEEALDNKAEELMSNGKKKESFIADKAVDIGLKVAQFGLDYINFIKHFEGITQEELGVYRPEEHIDNPIYATVYDNLSNPKSAYYCPPRKNEKGSPQTKPSIGNVYGMKRFIKNEENGIEKLSDTIDGAKGKGKYENGTLPTAVSCLKDYFKSGVKKYKAGTNTHAKYKGLSDIGAAMHILEDYFAHTNFCEILLIKHGVSAYPWVNFMDAELVDYNQSRERFEVKNNQAKKTDNKTTENDIKEKDFFNIIDIDKKLSVTGSCVFLPSFSFDGFYFTYQPKGGSKKLYVARPLINKNEVVVYAKLASGAKPIYERDPLKLQCILERKKQVYGYFSLTVELVDENYSLTYGKKNYAAQIPIVSGYFAAEDSIHSLLGVAEKMFKESNVNMKSMFMTNDFKYAKGLELIDMLVYHILSDLMLTQQEQEKPAKETGVDYSKLMEYYKELIVMREVILGIAENAKKKAGIAGIVLYLFERLLNATYASVMNLVKSLAVEMLRTVNHVIKDWQSMQVVSDIGTNPSHTQLAKDEFHHPLHSLAGDLALHCAVEIGKDIQTMFTSQLSSDEIASFMIDKALSFMQHPCHSDWADEIAQKWIQGNGDRIEKLHEEEYDFKKAEKFGQDVKAILAELEKKYLAFIKFLEATYQSIMDLWEDLKESYEAFKEAVEKLIRRGKKYMEKMQQKMDEYYEMLKILSHQIFVKNESQLDYTKERQEFVVVSTNFKKEINGLLSQLDREETQAADLESLEKQLTAYHRKSIDELKDGISTKTPFESKLYQYCYHDTQDKSYKEFGGMMHEYYAFREKQIKVEEQYLALSADQQLAQLNYRKNRSMLLDDDDYERGLAINEKEYNYQNKIKGLG